MFIYLLEIIISTFSARDAYRIQQREMFCFLPSVCPGAKERLSECPDYHLMSQFMCNKTGISRCG